MHFSSVLVACIIGTTVWETYETADLSVKNNQTSASKYETRSLDELFKLKMPGHGAITFHLVSILTSRKKPSEYRRNTKSYDILWSEKNLRSLESIFYFHPNAIVNIHSNSLATEDFEAFIELGYQISVVPIDLDKVSRSTALEGITKQARFEKWETGPYWYSHVSDMLRLLILFRYGGVYLDTDVVITRSFHDLEDSLGYQDEKELNGAVMIFRKPRNRYLKWCIEEFNRAYDSTVWDLNGPKLLSRVYRRFVKTKGWSAVVKALPPSTFQLIPWDKVNSHCFHNSTDEEMYQMVVKIKVLRPYAIHWNSHHNRRREVLPGTICEYLFTRFCVLCSGEPVPPAHYPIFQHKGLKVSLP